MANIGWKQAQAHDKAMKNRQHSSEASQGMKASTKFEHARWPALSFVEPSQNAQDKYFKLQSFMENRVFPNEQRILQWMENVSPSELWYGEGSSASSEHNLLQQLKDEAKEEGLWNLFVPPGVLSVEEGGAGLSNLE